MRRTKLFVLAASLLIVSCSKKPSRPERIESFSRLENSSQKAAVEVYEKPPDSAEVQKGLKQLEGVWNEVATEMDGKKRETPADDSFMSILTFKGDELTEKKKGDKIDKLSRSGKIRIDPTKTPKRLEFFISGAKQSAKEVYELRGDELKVCSILGSNSFPSEITGKKPQHLLVTYKRVKK